MNIKKTLVVASSVLFFTGANAEFIAGTNITAAGCDAANTCFIQVDTPLTSCVNSAQINWDGNTPNGRSWYASALTALAAGSEVNLGTTDVCVGNFDTLNFLTVR